MKDNNIGAPDDHLAHKKASVGSEGVTSKEGRFSLSCFGKTSFVVRGEGEGENELIESSLIPRQSSNRINPVWMQLIYL